MSNSSSELMLSVGHLQKPTSATWNNLIAGIIKPGVYQGGRVIPGGGLNLLVEPFIARTTKHTVRLEGEEWFQIRVPQSGRLHLVAKVFRSNMIEDKLNLEFVASANLTDDMIILATVNMPLGAATITEAMISFDDVTKRSLDDRELLGRLRSGSGTFQTGNVITHNLGHTNYIVEVSAAATEGLVGNITIDKQKDKFTVLISGTATSAFDWFLMSKTDIPTATGVVYGQTEVLPTNLVTLKHGLKNLNYFPIITPMETPHGPWWVEKSADSFTVRGAGAKFRAMWAAMPTQASQINGTAQWTDVSIPHDLDHTDYRVFYISLAANNPVTPPKFTKNAGSVTIEAPGSAGPFQYLIVDDSLGLTGEIQYSQKAQHMLNREDYISLIRPLGAEYAAVSFGNNDLTLESNINDGIEYLVLPATSSWALGDWTRPTIAMAAERIEIKGDLASDVKGKGSVVHREILSQDNFITKGIARLYPANNLGYTVVLTLYVNGQEVDTLSIPGTQTYTVNELVPYPVHIGDVIEVKLMSDTPPRNSMSFNWFGLGLFSLKEWDNIGDVVPSALRISRLKLFGEAAGKTVWEVPAYIPGSNNLTISINERQLFITNGEYTELDTTHIKTAEPYYPADVVEVQIISQLTEQTLPIGSDPGITAEQAATIEGNRIAIVQLFELLNTFAVTKEQIKALGQLENDILGNVTGNLLGNSEGTHTGPVVGDVQGNATGLTGLQLTVAQLNEILEQLTNGGNSTLHYHESDRDRANHTGTQLLSTISDAGTAASRNVGTATGNVAVLGANGQFDLTVLTKALDNVSEVATTAEMLALADSKRGDLAKVGDSEVYVLRTSDGTNLNNWLKISDLLNIVDGKINISLLGNALANTYPAANQTAMLSLNAKKGDHAIRGDEPYAYVLSGDDPTVLGQWTRLPNTQLDGELPPDAVRGAYGMGYVAVSLNAGAAIVGIKRGDVVLAQDVKIAYMLIEDEPTDNDSWLAFPQPEVSVTINGKSGKVITLTMADFDDFQDAVANNPAVLANTAKKTNAVHTGEVTGEVELTIAPGAVIYNKLGTSNVAAGSNVFLIADVVSGSLLWGSAVTEIAGKTGKITELTVDMMPTLEAAVNAWIVANPTVMANTAKAGNATHTGDVVGSEALTIQPNVIKASSIKATGYANGRTIVADTTAASGWSWQDAGPGGSSAAIDGKAKVGVLNRMGELVVQDVDMVKQVRFATSLKHRELQRLDLGYVEGSYNPVVGRNIYIWENGVRGPVANGNKRLIASGVPLSVTPDVGVKVDGTVSTWWIDRFKMPAQYKAVFNVGQAFGAQDVGYSTPIGITFLASPNNGATELAGTLSIVRSPGGSGKLTPTGTPVLDVDGFTWRLIRNWGRPDESVVADYTVEVPWGNGAVGKATATEAGFNVSTGMQATWKNLGNVMIKIIREGNIFTFSTTGFGSNVEIAQFSYDVSKLEDANLSSMGPTLGYVSRGIAKPTWAGAAGTMFRRAIYADLLSGDVYEHDSTAGWVSDLDLTPNDLLVPGTVSIDPLTGCELFVKQSFRSTFAAEGTDSDEFLYQTVMMRNPSFTIDFTMAGQTSKDIPIAELYAGEVSGYDLDMRVYFLESGQYLPADSMVTVYANNTVVHLDNNSTADLTVRIFIRGPR